MTNGRGRPGRGRPQQIALRGVDSPTVANLAGEAFADEVDARLRACAAVAKSARATLTAAVATGADPREALSANRDRLVDAVVAAHEMARLLVGAGAP